MLAMYTAVYKFSGSVISGERNGHIYPKCINGLL